MFVPQAPWLHGYRIGKIFPLARSYVAKTMWNLYRCGFVALWLSVAKIVKKKKVLCTSFNIKNINCSTKLCYVYMFHI